MLRDLWFGIRMFVWGVTFWHRRPRVMTLSLIPTGIVFVLAVIVLLPLLSGILVLADMLPDFAARATPFADTWPVALQQSLRLVITLIGLALASALTAAVFAALTLIVGDAFYERIAHAVHIELGGSAPPTRGRFWRNAADALLLGFAGWCIIVGVVLIGLLPIIGTAIAGVIGYVLSAWLIARELVTRTFDAWAVPMSERRAALRPNRWKLVGLGILIQLCFLVPLGALVVMPPAVAGATALARNILNMPSPQRS